MKYLHQQDLVHRDLKPLTILLDSHNNTPVGTLASAPEGVPQQRWHSKFHCAGGSSARILRRKGRRLFLRNCALGDADGQSSIAGLQLQPDHRFRRALELAAAAPEEEQTPREAITQFWSKDPAELPAFTKIAPSFRQSEVEFEPCEKIDWHNLSENYCQMEFQRDIPSTFL
jgi:hypothetical protein